jgi:hypothetical protein
MTVPIPGSGQHAATEENVAGELVAQRYRLGPVLGRGGTQARYHENSLSQPDQTSHSTRSTPKWEHMQPDVVLGLALAVVGLIVAAPAVARSSAVEMRLMLALCGVALSVALAYIHVSSDQASGNAACGTVASPHDQTPDGVYSGCSHAITTARSGILLLLIPSLLVTVESGARIRRKAS